MSDDISSHVNASGWIKTRSGMVVPVFEFSPDHANLYDISWSLCRLGRFNGHASRFLSVSDHSVNVMVKVAELDPQATAKTLLTALMHDAAEAYFGDVVRPIRKHPDFGFYNEAIENCERALAVRFDTHFPLPDVVVEADNAVLATELECFMLTEDRQPETYDFGLAEDRFIRQFMLQGGRP